jgi:pyridoxamine 5'-phosphate oxidase
MHLFKKYLFRESLRSNNLDEVMSLEEERREYQYGRLTKESLLETPAAQFEFWMSQALEAKIQDPTAMSIGTLGEDGMPWQRMVLLKGFSPDGLIFYTNLGSQKAKEIAAHNKVSALFPWLQMDRQVIVAGEVQPMGIAESAAYFLSRPRESQLAAWSSQQSRAITSRQFLDSQFQKMKSKFQQGKIPVPDFWGGFRIVPQQWEFWQGGENRLHDRFRYIRNDNAWEVKRLAP